MYPTAVEIGIDVFMACPRSVNGRGRVGWAALRVKLDEENCCKYVESIYLEHIGRLIAF
jgi:hypothetical protein